MEGAKILSENLSDQAVTRRLRGGIVMLMLALLLAALLEHWNASVYSRIWLFIPFFLAENAFFQAIHKTCGFSAMKGIRHTVDGDEKIADRLELEACRCQGKTQLVQSFAGALLLTALFTWIA